MEGDGTTGNGSGDSVSLTSKHEYISALHATLGMLQRRSSVILPSALQQAGALSPNLSQLLGSYNHRLRDNILIDFDAFRQRLILRVQREIDACAADLDSTLNPPDGGTIKIRRHVSQKKWMANRQNSLRSTGPRTREGKRNARKNALKHGLLSEEIEVLVGEASSDFENLRLKLREGFAPPNQIEEQLVDSIAVLSWKIDRCISFQDSLLCATDSDDRWRRILRYEGSLHRHLREVICEISKSTFERGVTIC